MIRRQFLATTALFASILAAPVAFAATPADQFVIAMNMSSMHGLDPNELNQLESAEIVANLYERLIVLPADDITKPVPGLAGSWTVLEDGKTLTFKIRSGVNIHSGNPLTAKDVEWSLKHLGRALINGVFKSVRF